MELDIHVVGLCGCLRDGSETRVALRTALDATESMGATTTLVDLRTYDLPLLDGDEATPPDAEALRETVRDADAVLLATPMYHGSYSSPLKTALDYCGFEEFEGKTVGLLAVSGCGFPTPALEHLRSVCRALNAWTLPVEVGIPDARSNIEDGEITDEDTADRVQRLGERLVLFAGVDEYPEVASTTLESVTGF
ncbi:MULTISPECIES: NAD(P)H-dependent oxidoreductase [unclassified Haladaptatus]|uniref:NADPH-dependent FMN reductase n=1 Tax=unclassified Haladaptatus TaxID=2622732 RepID=UPI0007B4C8FF|nr:MULTISPECIES: NAD(P)H-dependent oxidoreductase [unclassified Haladaptatus]KZN24392.1 FMN reductase [Haladaptatus sp. R4]MCO8244364.1 NAD(P)H-dependent oxidoreductase [Haladaptatus sp. AB643]MCO8254013.1 NAD(P)H-dependent oxidoreductase [Haladaptatus sp. AB618]